MNRILSQYIQLVDFLGKVLGTDYEVALHDLSRRDSYSIIAIANGFNSGRQIGSPITGKALEFISDKVYLKENYQINYTGRTNNITTRSSTMFIKDEKGKLIGMLCINYNTTRCNEVINEVLEMFHMPPLAETQVDEKLPQPSEETPEYFVKTIENLISNMLDISTPRERLTQEEKIEIVRNLNQKSVFLIKGAVSEVARQLCSSEASIYRYLSKINKEKTNHSGT